MCFFFLVVTAVCTKIAPNNNNIFFYRYDTVLFGEIVTFFLSFVFKYYTMTILPQLILEHLKVKHGASHSCLASYFMCMFVSTRGRNVKRENENLTCTAERKIEAAM